MQNQASCLSETQLAGYLAGQLQDTERMSVERHAGRCTSCRTRLVDRFEYQRESAIISPTPKDVVERGLALIPASREAVDPVIPPRVKPPRTNGSSGLKWAIILILLAALVALLLVFIPDPFGYLQSLRG